MHADIPYIRCWVRLEHLTGLYGTEEGYAFAVQSFPGRALGFHVMLQSGAHYRNVPIHALCTRQEAPPVSLADCQLWDCFSFRPVAHVFQYLQDHEAVCLTRSGQVNGRYLFTVDWLPDTPERPGFILRPEQNKCAHVLETEAGNLVALPTNRIAWRDGYFIGQNPHPETKGYEVQETIHRSESSGWDVSRTDSYFYRPPA